MRTSTSEAIDDQLYLLESCHPNVLDKCTQVNAAVCVVKHFCRAEACLVCKRPFASKFHNDNDNNSEKSHICQMKAWPYKQECGGHDPTKKESVVLVKLALWQSVHVQTVKDSVQCILS